MLKRQRGSSPQPPTSFSLPQDIATEDVIDIRDLKRRRVIPPSLDGHTRGWNTQNQNIGDEEEDEEYTEVDGQGTGIVMANPQPSSNIEYQSVNSVLKEIHILHKHRQLFSPQTQQPSASVDTHPSTPVDILSTKMQPSKESLHMPWVESVRVYEHYEDTNKSLASAFLSRRQKNTP